jgi:SAM-dependent methyltransferase
MEPNAIASTEDFEFAALSAAKNYREALAREFGPHLNGAVLEVGSGIGQFTEILKAQPDITRLTAVEPHGPFCDKHRQAFPRHDLVEGTVDDLPPGTAWNSIVSLNVLEHIGDDEGELKKYAALLREKKGALCLLVPARPEIYAPIDRDFGHFRRYTRPELHRKLTEAGFQITRLHYYNFAGYFAWWLNFLVMKKRGFEIRKVVFYDRCIFPAVHFLESTVARPPIGQSLLAVGVSGLP